MTLEESVEVRFSMESPPMSGLPAPPRRQSGSTPDIRTHGTIELVFFNVTEQYVITISITDNIFFTTKF